MMVNRFPPVNNASSSFPGLVRRSHTMHTIPRRYEDSKSAMIQNFTHRDIMALGNAIHEKTIQQSLVDKQSDMSRAKEDLWAEANVQQCIALEHANEVAVLQHEKDVKKLKKNHDKVMKEKLLQVEAEMQATMHTALQEVREEHEWRLEVMISTTKHNCHELQLLAVQAAHEEEQKISNQHLIELKAREEEKLIAEQKKCMTEKEKALNDLSAEKDKESEAHIKQTQQDEQNIAEQKLSEMAAMYEKKLNNLQEDITERNCVISNLQGEVARSQEHNKRVQNEYLDLRADFQDFIDNLSKFDKGKSNYLIAPVKSFKLPCIEE